VSNILNITLKSLGNRRFEFFIYDAYPNWNEWERLNYKLQKSKNPEILLKQYVFGVILDYMSFENIKTVEKFYEEYSRFTHLEEFGDFDNYEEEYKIPDSNPNEPATIVKHFIEACEILESQITHFYKDSYGREQKTVAFKLLFSLHSEKWAKLLSDTSWATAYNIAL